MWYGVPVKSEDLPLTPAPWSVSHGVLFLGHVIVWVNEGGNSTRLFPSHTNWSSQGFLTCEWSEGWALLLSSKPTRVRVSALRSSNQQLVSTAFAFSPGSGSQLGNIPKLKRNGYSIIWQHLEWILNASRWRESWTLLPRSISNSLHKW